MELISETLIYLKRFKGRKGRALYIRAELYTELYTCNSVNAFINNRFLLFD